MLNIKTLLDDFVSVLRKDEYFKEIKITQAYPFSVKPTALKDSIIAVGCSDISMNNCHIGFRETAGDVGLFADIFVPMKYGSAKVTEIFTRLCLVLKEMNIISIQAQRIYADSETMAYVMKTQLNFRGELELGGDGGE